MTKVALFGLGRMGKLIAGKLIDCGMSVVAAFDVDEKVVGEDVGALAGKKETGVKVTHPSKSKNVLAKTKPDVAVDFTKADACIQNIRVCAENKVSMVVGTTGFSEQQKEEIKKIVEENGVGMVLSPNMSVGVNVFWKLAQEAAKSLKGYDVEIIDMHHRFKKDAPSGTGLRAAELIAEAQGRKLDNLVYGRKGAVSRSDGEIGIHAIRAGNIIGEHTIIFASQTERVELKHIAQTRDAFVDGVPKAVEFIAGKKGLYGMDDVLKLK